MKRQFGFTVVEVVIALLVVALLGSAGYIYYLKNSQTQSQRTPVTTTPTPKPSATLTPTPTGQKNTISKDYPILHSQQISPDGEQVLTLRSKTDSSSRVIILSDSQGYHETLITQDPDNGSIENLTSTTWSADGKYAYVVLGYPDANNLWLLRLDGHNFSQSNHPVLKPEDTSAGPTYWPSSLQQFKWEGDTLTFGITALDMSWNAVTGKLDVGAVGD